MSQVLRFIETETQKSTMSTRTQNKHWNNLLISTESRNREFGRLSGAVRWVLETITKVLKTIEQMHKLLRKWMSEKFDIKTIALKNEGE